MLRAGGVLLIAAAASGCGASEEPRRAVAASSAPSPRASESAPAPSASVPVAVAAPARAPSVAPERVRELLPDAPGCAETGDAAEVRCRVGHAFAGHERERELALSLFEGGGDVVVTERPHTMDGGFRGLIQIVGELPVGKHARHLEWIASAQREQRELLTAIERDAGRPANYRASALLFRFLRSVGRTTPSAYASSWEIGYNVSGSLNTGLAKVTETIVHEIFHLNDQAHGDWSRRVLGPKVDAIVAKCGTKMACLAPYAPHGTTVRGGTYYAFQPNNGDYAHEYAAELATRYFLEQRAARRGEAYPPGLFKCGPAPNAENMRALVDEFFAGVDRTPACPE